MKNNKSDLEPKEDRAKSVRGKKKRINIRINLLSQIAKQVKTVGVIIFFLSLPLALGLFYPGSQEKVMYPAEPMPEDEVRTEEMIACQRTGGKWYEFADSCLDYCPNQIGEPVCAQVVTQGCDCGRYECWDGEGCVLNP